MKIKNLKLNEKSASKLAACVLVGTLVATTLIGCRKAEERNNLLKGTMLENTCVITLEDGTKDIAIAVSSCDRDEYHHYYSVISGEYFSGKKCESNAINRTVIHHYGITNEENIISYLTTDDLEKAIQGKLDNDDIITIISRVMEPTNEEENTKTK